MASTCHNNTGEPLAAIRLVFLGPPGAGKGTQARWLARRCGVTHLSSGDMFRDAIAAQTPLGRQVQPWLARGELVPDDTTVALVMERLFQPDCQHGFILDGFPRTRIQAEAMDQQLGLRSAKLDAVLLPLVPDHELIDRLIGRRVCSNPHCQVVFHVNSRPPKREGVCDLCGGILELRNDDRPETVARRLKVYRDQTAELVDYFRSRGLLAEFDGTGPVEVVGARLLELVQHACGAEKVQTLASQVQRGRS